MLVARIRQVAYNLHSYLGTGLLEKVYENGLAHRLRKEGFRVDAQKPLKVYDDDGFCLGEYFADLIVEGGRCKTNFAMRHLVGRFRRNRRKRRHHRCRPTGFCNYLEDQVIVELKTVRCIANEHYAQILNYLKITGAPAGLLINFGSYKFEVRTVIPRHTTSSSPSTLLHGST